MPNVQNYTHTPNYMTLLCDVVTSRQRDTIGECNSKYAAYHTSLV